MPIVPNDVVRQFNRGLGRKELGYIGSRSCEKCLKKSLIIIDVSERYLKFQCAECKDIVVRDNKMDLTKINNLFNFWTRLGLSSAEIKIIKNYIKNTRNEKSV
jgi:hypothetical protein